MEPGYSFVLPYSTENSAERAADRPWPYEGARFRTAFRFGPVIVEEWLFDGPVYVCLDAATGENVTRGLDGPRRCTESLIDVAATIATAMGGAVEMLWPMARIHPKDEPTMYLTSRKRR